MQADWTNEETLDHENFCALLVRGELITTLCKCQRCTTGLSIRVHWPDRLCEVVVLASLLRARRIDVYKLLKDSDRMVYMYALCTPV